MSALIIDDDNGAVLVDGGQVALTRKEYDLLRALACDPSRLFTKDELYLDAWGNMPLGIQTRTLDSHASRLRLKLNANGGVRFVVNVWGKGYRLVDPGHEGSVDLRQYRGSLVDHRIAGAVDEALEAMGLLARALQTVASELARVSRQERERSSALHLRRVA